MASHVHRTHRSGWLRAGMLGANDGVLSISGLMLGVAATHASAPGIVAAGVAGLVAGALSMGAGEYVSVSSQADTERADLEIEREALENDSVAEHAELRDIYIRRGLDHALATQVAQQLMAHDTLSAHARDDIGITDALTARPLQAAMTSALSFTVGGLVPLLAGVFAPHAVNRVVVIVSLVVLAALGALAARVGGAPILRGTLRVLVSGAVAMIA
ncbi:MAG TPA: VIT family protein, partial [Xanthomonadaceae bacterium]|nr:VIT family protein [Xanthomonadaceae bacterium]